MYKFLLIFISFFSFSQDNQSLLWEISGNGLEKPSYLFGTIHRNEKELFQFSDSVYVALNNVDGVALETDIFAAFNFYDSRYGEVEFTFDRNGNPYVKHAYETYTKFGNEKGMPQFMDALFQQYAENAEKDFYALDYIKFQKEYNPNENIFRFIEPLYYDIKLTDLYLKGDIEEIHSYLENKRRVFEDDTTQVIKMVNRLDTLLQSNRSIFCAVHVGRFLGENGFIQLLSNKGYTVRRVESSYSENEEFKSKVNSYSYYPIEIDSLGFRAYFPGEPQLVFGEDEDFEFKMIYRDYGQGNTYEIEIYTLDEDASFSELAQEYIASPDQTQPYKVELNNGGEAMEGLSDAYPIGYYWTRVLLAEDYFVVLKAYGGNYFMASERAQRFFQQVELD